MASLKNAAYVAIMQVGVIVAGVLAAGFWVKARTDMHWTLSVPVALLTKHTGLFFAIPMVWITFAAILCHRPEVSEGGKDLVLFSGVLVLIALGVFVFYADITPLFSIMWTLNGDDDR